MRLPRGDASQGATRVLPELSRAVGAGERST